MKRFLTFLVVVGLLLSLICGSPAFAVNTIRTSGGAIEITAIDSNWSYTDTYVRIHSIIFIPAAVDDRCIIRDGSATGAVFFDSNTAIDAYDGKRIPYDGLQFKPYLAVADGQYGAAARVIIILER
jgi:hypothetical protein